jgi:cyclophilin family peptidyl-prolyl cis-trans isomerase/HEAT repeat protein
MTIRTVLIRGRWAVGLAGVMAAAGCAASAPPTLGPVARPTQAVASLDQKVSWVLRLEQQRLFRDPGGEPFARPSTAASAEAPLTLQPAEAPLALQPAESADLGALLLDPEAGLRRRAALAIGRVGRPEGHDWLAGTLAADPDDEVRATAAFALGLLGRAEAAPALEAALTNTAPIVRARAIEGLGLIGVPAASSADAIAAASAGCPALLAPMAPDDEGVVTPEVEACRQALFAFVRLRQYDALARVALDAQGQPVSRWWPVAFSLQRINDERARPALRALVSTPGVYTAAFALRGLASARDPEVIAIARALAAQADADVRLRISAVRALAQAGEIEDAERLVGLVFDPATPPNLALEAVTALGTLRDPRVFNDLVDLFNHAWPGMRAAAMASAAAVDPDAFVLVLSSLRPDPEPSVRAGLASVLAGLGAERGRPALEQLAQEQDVRVAGPVLGALARIDAPDLTARLFSALEAPDYVVRATAAGLVGERRPEGGAARLAAAFDRADGEVAIDARVAILNALAAYADANATEVARRALSDREWPVRLAAAAVLARLGETAEPERPAPLRQPAGFFQSEALLRPAFSPHAFIETRHGTIEIELDMVNAAATSLQFIELVRSGFYNGLKVHRLVPHFVIQTGDPRGDGAGGPGYTLRDEFSTRPYHRGTVGMALSGPETGGSQFFITLSPQPHLDSRYTVFGHVVQGDEILDRIQQGDAIDRVRIWDGVTFR